MTEPRVEPHDVRGLARLLAAAEASFRDVEAEALAELDLRPWMLRVLDHLARVGPRSPSQVATDLEVAQPTVSGWIAGADAQGPDRASPGRRRRAARDPAADRGRHPVRGPPPPTAFAAASCGWRARSTRWRRPSWWPRSSAWWPRRALSDAGAGARRTPRRGRRARARRRPRVYRPVIRRPARRTSRLPPPAGPTRAARRPRRRAAVTTRTAAPSSRRAGGGRRRAPAATARGRRAARPRPRSPSRPAPRGGGRSS